MEDQKPNDSEKNRCESDVKKFSKTKKLKCRGKCKTNWLSTDDGFIVSQVKKWSTTWLRVKNLIIDAIEVCFACFGLKMGIEKMFRKQKQFPFS